MVTLLLLLACAPKDAPVDSAPVDSAPVDSDPVDSDPIDSALPEGDLSDPDFTPALCDAVFVGSRRFDALQTALDAAPDGARVLICPGTWSAGLIHSDGLIVEGWGAPEEVILDAQGAGRVLTIDDAVPAPRLTLRALTLTGGDALGGGALAVFNGELTLERLRVTGNRAALGGGLSLAFTSAQADDLELSGNEADEGGGVLLLNSQLLGEGLLIEGNVAQRGGGVFGESADGYGDAAIEGATLRGNQADEGGGLYVTGESRASPDLLIQGCTVEGNLARVGGGVRSNTDYGGLRVIRSALVDNSATEAGGGVSFVVGAALTDVELRGNSAPLGGAVAAGEGIASLSLSGGAVQANRADEGGGLWLGASTTLTLDAVDFGEGEDSNTPDDAHIAAQSFDWEGLTSLRCQGDACSPP